MDQKQDTQAVEPIDAPAEAQKQEEQKGMTLEQSTAIAEMIKSVMTAVSMHFFNVTKDELVLARQTMVDRRSKAEALGPMFNPHSWQSKVEFFDQGIKKLDALIMLYEAEEAYQKMQQTKIKEEQGAAVMRSILGI